MVKTCDGYFEGLHGLAAALYSADSSENVLNNLVEITAECMKAKGCSLLLLSWDKRPALHTASFGLSQQ